MAVYHELDKTKVITVSNAQAEIYEAPDPCGLKVVVCDGIGEVPEGKPAQLGKNMDTNHIVALIREEFGKDAATAMRIAKAESGLNPNTESNTDRMRDGRAFSVGLYQINLTWHSIDGVECHKAFSGKNYTAKVIDEPLYKQCVQLAKDPVKSIATAKSIGDWTKWSTF